MKGPAIFLAQFADDVAPFNSLESITKWAAELGYKGVQIPTWDGRLFDLEKAAESQDYCDEVTGICAESGLAVTELSTHLQGQLVAVHPAYGEMFDAFARLAETPSIATSAESVRKGYRKFPQGSHIIFFRECAAHRIEIIRVLHKRMDAEAHLSPP